MHKIIMPNKDKFESVEAYYATLFHELTHWTKGQFAKESETEENWENFGSDSYSKEELSAEIGANFLLSACGIDASKTYNNSVSYISHWAERLGKEPKLVITASTQSSKTI